MQIENINQRLPEPRTNIAIDADYDQAIDALIAAQRKLNVKYPDFYPVAAKLNRDLFDIYLDNLPAGMSRQDYNCNRCRAAIGRFGALVYVSAEAEIDPVLFPRLEGDNPWFATFNAVGDAVRAATAFTTPDLDQAELATIGEMTNGSPKSETGTFTHINLIENTFGSHVNYGQLQSSFHSRVHLRNTTTIETLLTRAIADPNGFYLRESHRELLNKLLAFGERYNKTENPVTRKLLVLGNQGLLAAIINSSVDELLERCSRNDVEAAIRTYNEITDGARYQRAEREADEKQLGKFGEWLEAHGMLGSIQRRFARLDEMVFDWKTQYVKASELKSADRARAFFNKTTETYTDLNKPAELVETNGGVMSITEHDFLTAVLPKAQRIILHRPPFAGRISTTLATTTDDATAPPILVWDHVENRNPIDIISSSRLSFDTPSAIEVVGTWVDPSKRTVTGGNADAATLLCFQVFEPSIGVATAVGNGLWAESVKPELYDHRRAIETYNKQNALLTNPQGEIIALTKLVSGFATSVFDGTRWTTFSITQNTGFHVHQTLNGLA